MDWGLFQVADGVAVGAVDTAVYSVEALKKVAYRFANRCTLALGENREGVLRASWIFQTGASAEQMQAVLREFFQELLDQDLRETIARETKHARSVILAHAFSRTSLLDDK
jgi:His-Xaa-Ser system protein HxsD